MLAKERPDHTTEEIAEDGEINLLDFVREDHDDVDYKNCNFILAGAVEVERLCSKIVPESLHLALNSSRVPSFLASSLRAEKHDGFYVLWSMHVQMLGDPHRRDVRMLG